MAKNHYVSFRVTAEQRGDINDAAEALRMGRTQLIETAIVAYLSTPAVVAAKGKHHEPIRKTGGGRHPG